jgi:alcohol dehydrogenase, propanol-preferring
MRARDAVPETMRAMVLERVGEPLVARRRPLPALTEPGQVLLRVRACGVCRTDLHLVDGELPDPALPLIPGHQIVGEVVAMGAGVARFRPGDRVGVPWLGYTDGTCRYCRRDQENLCPNARFTGYTIDGGYAEYALADARYCFPLPEAADLALAPLLCAGLIGFRTWRLAGGTAPERLGIYGFGAAAHIVTQIAVFHGQEVYAFTREGDRAAQDFARRLGAVWAGGSDETPPQVLDAAMIFAPVGALMVTALRHVDRGGTVVSGGIHMSDIPSFPYRLLWEERTLTSVANLTRADGEDFLELAARIPVRTEVHSYPLEQANAALKDLREGRFTGAAVLVP